MNPPPDLKVGERFQITYDPDADPTGYFAFLKTAWFEVVKIEPGKIEVKQVSQ